jgi:hypothetical protein
VHDENQSDAAVFLNAAEVPQLTGATEQRLQGTPPFSASLAQVAPVGMDAK